MYHIFGRPYAVACMSGEEGSHVTGIVRLYCHDEGTMVVAQIRGLPESVSGFYGFHIHEGGNCRGVDFSGTGGHYDPQLVGHPRHAGDLPSLLGCNGKAFMTVLTKRFRPRDVVGRTVVIHDHPDDFRGQPSGDSGKKIACGVIRKV